jgi:hypothetical protein
MSSVIDLEAPCEAQQVAQAAPHASAGAFEAYPTVEVVTAREEEVGGAETHKMGILEPHTSSVESSLWSASTGQDINGEAQPVFSSILGPHTSSVESSLWLAPTGQDINDEAQSVISGIRRPHTNSAESPLWLASTGQDINDEAQPVISQVEGVTSNWPCCLISRRLFCSVTGSGGGSDAPEVNVDGSRSRFYVSGTTTSDRLTQAEAQIRACFLTVVEISIE